MGRKSENNRRPGNTQVFGHTLSDPALLRGMQTFEALRCGALIYRDAGGSEETWQMSRPVGRIRWFISHNWSVSRWAKFVVLCHHFNWYPACAVTLLLLALILLLTAAGALPVVEIHELDSEGFTWSGVVAQPTATWVFIIVLLTWHEFAGRFGLMKQPVFLDKTCISQTDPELKHKGIISLAGFLSNSDAMLVVYTDVYLRKMWTVFELATALVLFPEMPIRVVPTFVPVFLLSASVLTYVFFRIVFLWNWRETTEKLGRDRADWALGSILFVMEIGLVVFLRLLAKRLQHIEAAAAAFRINQARLFDEKDRGPVCNTVASFMREKGLVPPETSLGDCLDAFDDLVRTKVPRFLLSKFSRGLPYDVVVVLLLPLTGMAVDQAGAEIYKNRPASSILQHALAQLGLQLTLVPIKVKVATKFAHCYLNLEGWVEVAYTVMIGFFMALTAGLIYAIRAVVMWEAEDAAGDELVEGIMWVGLALLTAYLYYTPTACRRAAGGAAAKETEGQATV